MGAEVDDAIASTLIAMVKDAYVRGDAEIEYVEDMVAAILRGQPVAFLAPGERVIRAARRQLGERRAG
jgi:hypothetical protein